ncbi:MAG: PilZ domain-containing protein, partial [Deltaproteobacteria bacterium]
MGEKNDTGGGKRRHKRVELFSKVKVRAGESEQELLAGNVSAGGIFLRSNRPLEPGQQVSLEIDMGGTPVTVDVGEVKWAKPFEPVSVDGSIPGMGVEFKQMSEQARRRIESFIEEALGAQQASTGGGNEAQAQEPTVESEPPGAGTHEQAAEQG